MIKSDLLWNIFNDDPDLIAALQRKGTPRERILIKGEKGEPGKDGYTPRKGIDYFDGKNGVNGLDGKTPTKRELLELIEPLIPPVVEAKMPEIPAPVYKTEVIKEELTITEDLVKEIIKLMRRLPEKDRIEIQDIRNASSFIFNGTRYKTEELMHGGSSGASSGLTILVATGTIDDSNVVFTFTQEPTLININGAFYQKTGGAITWTYLAGTVTLSVPVGTGGSIYGIA